MKKPTPPGGGGAAATKNGTALNDPAADLPQADVDLPRAIPDALVFALAAGVWIGGTAVWLACLELCLQ
jgi:hypothetical protein